MAANAAKKGAKFTKVAREIQVAARLGGPDPNANSRLRMAIDAARELSCPKDTIERAIRKGAGLDADASAIEDAIYEGFAPHRVPVIVECQTDNRTRTAADIRNLFNRNGGQLGEMGSVGWMFDRVSLIDAKPSAKGLDPETEAIEAGANEVEPLDNDRVRFLGAPEDLKAIEQALTSRGWTVQTAELSYKPKSLAELTEAQKKDVIEFIQLLDDNDDTHRIHAALDL